MIIVDDNSWPTSNMMIIADTSNWPPTSGHNEMIAEKLLRVAAERNGETKSAKTVFWTQAVRAMTAVTVKKFYSLVAMYLTKPPDI